MRRVLALPLAGALLVAAVPLGAAVAQAPGSVAGEVLPITRTVLDVQATIVDLDGGFATIEGQDGATIALDADVFFDFDQAVLRPEATAALEEVAAVLGQRAPATVHVEGHTDAVGDDTYNQRLSEQRAAAVRDFLAPRLPGVSFAVAGFGKTRPVAPNTTSEGQDNPAGRARNRRVELRLPG